MPFAAGGRLCLPRTHYQLILQVQVFPGGGFVSHKGKKSKWLWPLGLMATGVAGAAVAVLRGCWHQNMSWPIRAQEHSYQVCLGCGVKRLFDEEGFRGYGPYSYDLHYLIAWERARRMRMHRHTEEEDKRSVS